jgi:hypothetical protein
MFGMVAGMARGGLVPGQQESAPPMPSQASATAKTLFTKLYSIAQAVAKNPAPYETARCSGDAATNPDFPTVSQTQQDWANFMADEGNVLSVDENATYTPCVVQIGKAINNAEVACRMLKANATEAAGLERDAQDALGRCARLRIGWLKRSL